MKAVLYMVIPCYNEEEVLPVTSGLFLEELQLLIEKEKRAASFLSMTGVRTEHGRL